MAKRSDIQFTSKGATCRGWLYQPKKKGSSACIVMAHGFGGVREMRLDAYAERFAAAGYRVLVFDYRHFGSSGGRPRQLLSIRRQHQDWRAAIRFARSLPGVDAGRIILWGTSFSGGHVAFMAARDGNVAAVISQVPHLDGMATAKAAGIAQNLRLGFAALRDMVRMIFHLIPHYVEIVAAPGELGAMTAPGAIEGVMRLIPEGFKYETKVAARIFLSVAAYSPGKLAPKIACPWLVQVALRDLTTPSAPAEKAIARAPRGELIKYNLDHFDVYVPPHFERSVGDQLAFLQRHAAP
ncbi:MAG: alpha/beta hydrolase [Spirochaetes bacterium]|nr:alpha/beta hydrolase [Spirochaetota bacterium]